ncbi:MAG: F0F1 ATP synthase subunit beta, partial [Treponema sp.]|nr:F0F1 ATP synthase subunit beta [Treponema sp.]
MANTGYITQIVGPVVDVRFDEGKVPVILNALKVNSGDGRTVTLEVLQHIGDSRVRCVAMSATEGLSRGLAALDAGKPISV